VSTDRAAQASGPYGESGGYPGGSSEEDRSEAAQRAAYEAELSRITSAEMMLQAAVTLLNIGGRRLGLGGAPGSAAAAERDLEQVRDAIDAVRALMSILERRLPQELGPLRDALSQLQLAYAREAQGPPAAAQAGGAGEDRGGVEKAPGSGTEPAGGAEPRPVEQRDPTAAERKSDGPGPAESSGRLWVPGR
jgi:hypothetical protein